MKTFPFKLMFLLLLVDVLVMVCNKAAELGSHPGRDFYRNLLTQPTLWLGLGFSLLQLWTWTQILARTKLSLAYPIASLSYPLTMLAAQLIFEEHLNASIWGGGFLITLGVAIVGSSNQQKVEMTKPIQEVLK